MKTRAFTSLRPCRVCGCTKARACRGGCSWADAECRGDYARKMGPLCSRCDRLAVGGRRSVDRGMREVLLDLRKLRAFDRMTAQMGPAGSGLLHSKALQARNLIEAEYARAAKRMVYWLTPLGREVARRAA